MDRQEINFASQKSFERAGIYRFVASLFLQTRFKSVSFDDERAAFNTKRVSLSFKYSQIQSIHLHGKLFKKITIKAGLQRLTFRGLSKKDSKILISMFETATSKAWLRTFQPMANDVEQIDGWIENFWERKYFQRERVYNSQIKKANVIVNRLGRRIPKIISDTQQGRQITKIINFLDSPNNTREQNNLEYIPLELKRQSLLFDEIETNPLTDEQRLSVITDEDANLVVASAGSGKTSVIVSKAAWLIQKGLQQPKDILLLAFAADARREMSDRLEERINDVPKGSIKVHTFHSLGLEIVGKTTGKKPSLSKLADDKQKESLSGFIKDTILLKLKDDLYYNKINKWFSEFFAPYKSQFEFQNSGQYLSYLKENKIRSLKNETLKSYEECEIANFLYLNQINYIYEDNYKYETATESRKQYQPDFYLPDYDIYIEHLGLKGFGRTAPFVNRKDYLQSLRWKRELHKKHETTLVETYSCEKSSGVLTSNLRIKLSKHGVSFNRMNSDKVFEILNQQKQIDPFTTLVTTFLGHFKGSQLTEAVLRERNNHFGEKETTRNSAFIDVFMPIFESYEQRLKDEGAIDFHDMISQATQFLQSGEYKNNFKYIMVDEFQDISVGRSKLVSALQNSRDDTQLFCVGDDWQAIFRFAGSDINVMKDFGNYFGAFERTDLSVTFRSEEKITNQATNFILKNDAQIPKNVVSWRQSEAPSVFVHFKKQSNMDTVFADTLRHLSEILTDIQNAALEDEKPEVLILGRYRLSTYKTDYIDIIKELRFQFPDIRILYKTAHRSKGLESDYVIIIEVVDDFLGFPNERADDHVLDLVLAKAEDFPNSEERRLFYVALTRAKKKVFISTTTGISSEFVNELIQSPYDCQIRGKRTATLHNCNKCIAGKMVLRPGPFGNYWQCNNHPYCENKSGACPHCKEGYIPPNTKTPKRCDVCEQPVENCPKKNCNGYLQQENGPHGPFWGCSQFRVMGCNYTAKISYSATKVDQRHPEKNHVPQNYSPSNSEIDRLRETYPNAYRAWSKQQENQLRDLVRAGKNDVEISEIMGRQTSAIRSRKEKLEL